MTSRLHRTQSVSAVFYPFFYHLPSVKRHCELRVPAQMCSVEDKSTHFYIELYADNLLTLRFAFICDMIIFCPQGGPKKVSQKLTTITLSNHILSSLLPPEI